MYGRPQNHSALARLAVQTAVGNDDVRNDCCHNQSGNRHRPPLMTANFKQRNDTNHDYGGDAVALQFLSTHLFHE